MKPRHRRSPLRHFVAAAAAAVIAVVVVAVRPEDEPDEVAPPPPAHVSEARGAEGVPPPPSSPGGPTAAGVASVSASAPAEAPVAVRRVSGPGITPLPETVFPPQRVAPPLRPEPPPPPIVMRRLGLVRMDNPAEFSVGDIRVRLPGVAIIGPDEICRDRAGTEWPCGRRALAGVRAVVRGKAVDCPLPDKVRRGSFVADCRLAGADMAERLVASGWARALDRERALDAAERQAEAKGLGLHGTALPIGVDPFPDPGEMPADRTTAPLSGAEASAATEEGRREGASR
ncbi:MAG: hypothetical protein OEL76_08530 [Siculibacillus sp.]|nr:hypothetical protein [Siculibacillus sp.]